MSECSANGRESIEKKLEELLRESSRERPEKKFYSPGGQMRPSDLSLQLASCEDRPVRLNTPRRILSEQRIQTLMKENAKLSVELKGMQQNEAEFEEAAREVRTFLLRAEEDKKRLTQRIEKLAANERLLIAEVERLKRRGGTNGNSRPQSQKKVANMDEHIAGLEQDRDYWKGQVELLSQILACPSVVGPRSVVCKQGAGRVPSASKLNRTKAPRDDQRAKAEEDAKVPLEARRDPKQMKSRPSTGPTPFTRSRSLPRDQSCEETLENQKLRLERDELRMMVSRFENRIQEIQSNVQALTKERDNLHKLYSDAKNEIHRLHHDLYDVQNAANRRAVSQEVSTRLQAELERARREIERLVAEKEGLSAKFKKASEMESVDKQRHSKQMDYMEKALCEATNERDEVVGRIGQLKRRLEELQCNQMQIEQRLSERSEKLKKCTEETSNLQTELGARQRMLEETEAKLAAARQRNGELEAVCQRAEASVEEISRRLQLEREGSERLQGELQDVVCEREKMQQEIEELMKAKSLLQKGNKQLEKMYLATVSERDEVNVNCNRLNADVKSLEQKLRNAEGEITSWSSKFQIEHSTSESLAERCSAAERRFEESEFRARGLADELRENQDACYQLERQVKTMADSVERLRSDVGRLSEENESLRSNIELANKDKLRLEECIESLTAANRQLVRDRDDASHRHSLARERIAELEVELRSLEADLKRHNEAANKTHQITVDLKMQNEVLRQRSEELDAELLEALNKHRNAEERFHQAEVRASQLERELRLEHDDYLQVRSRLEATEEQRDAEEASRKLMAQRISDLEAQLTSQMMEVKEARSALEENARVLSRKEEQLMTSQASEQSLRSELAAAQSSLRESRRAVESGEQEGIRIKDKLASALRELQRLKTELHETVDERESLKTRADGYLSELARQERLLGERARERDLLAEQVRVATEDAETWRTRWTEAEAAAAKARLHDDEHAAEVTRVRDILESRERELSHCKVALERAESQVQILNQQMAETTEAAGLARAEVDALAAEVSRLRESLGHSEAVRGAKEREAVHARIEAEEARAKLQAAEAALLHANESAAAERENARNANYRLQSAREKEHAANLEVQERTNEMILLRERAVMAEEKVDAQQRETARLYERLAETEKEASRLSHSLSNERFERERLSTELRPLPDTYHARGYTGSSSRFSTSRLRSPHREKEEN